MIDLAFYLRLSMSDGDLGKDDKDQSYSIENQRILLQDFVETSGEFDEKVRVKEYIDDGYTGTNFDRPGFQQMVEDSKRGKIHVILVKDLSRLGRDYIGVGDYLEQIFPILGVRVIAVNSQYDSNNYIGNTMGLEMSISNLVNTLYSRDLSKKYRSCIQTKWRQGISTGGRVPFGYKKETDKSWRVDKEAAQIVRTIFDLALDHYNTAMIVNYLNEKEIPPPGKLKINRGEKKTWNQKVTDKEWLWNTRMVWVVLKNYAYTGALVQGKTSVVRACGKERRKKSPSELFITENHHEPIVSHEEYEMAQLVIPRQKERGLHHDSGFSLKSKIRCGNCGLRMDYNLGSEPVVYCAHAVSAGKMSSCEKRRYSAAKIENVVLGALRRELNLFKEMEKAIEERTGKEKDHLEILKNEIVKEIEILKAERIRQYEAYADGVVNQEYYLKKKQELNSKIETLQEKYEHVCTVVMADDNLQNNMQAVREKSGENDDLKQMTREIAEAFIEEVTIYDAERMEIRFTFDGILKKMVNRLCDKKDVIS